MCCFGFGSRDYFVYELGCVLRIADHLVGGDIVGPIRVTQQIRQFVTARDHSIEHIEVLREGTVVVGEVHPFAQIITFCISENRQ